MGLRIFVLKREADWDEHAGFVIAAQDHLTAVGIAVKESGICGDWSCVELDQDMPGIILEDFNRG